MKQNNPVCFKVSVLLFRGCKKSVSTVIPVPVSLVQYRHVQVSSSNPGKFCFQICGKIGTLAGHIGKGEIAYEEVLVLAGKMTVVEFCGG